MFPTDTRNIYSNKNVIESVKGDMFFSTLVGNKLVFLEGLHNDSLVLVYSTNFYRKDLFHNYVKSAIRNYEYCLYSSYDEYDFRNTLRAGEHLFISHLNRRVTDETFQRLVEMISGLRKDINTNHSTVGLKLLLDWGTSINKDNLKGLLELLERVTDLRKEMPVTLLTTFDVTSLDRESFDDIMRIIPRVIIMAPSASIAYTNTYPSPSIHAEFLDHEIAEKFVKTFLENIIFSMLLQEGLSGYSIIRNISNDYHVLLSQGTVYPLLYKLVRENFLGIQKIGKEIIYSPTPEGRILIDAKVIKFRRAYSFLYSMLRTSQRSLPV